MIQSCLPLDFLAFLSHFPLYPDKNTNSIYYIYLFLYVYYFIILSGYWVKNGGFCGVAVVFVIGALSGQGAKSADFWGVAIGETGAARFLGVVLFFCQVFIPGMRCRARIKLK